LARVQKAIREGAVGECRLMSRAAVPMVPRVRKGVAEAMAGEQWKAMGLGFIVGGETVATEGWRWRQRWRWRRRQRLLALLCGHHSTTNAFI